MGERKRLSVPRREEEAGYGREKTAICTPTSGRGRGIEKRNVQKSSAIQAEAGYKNRKELYMPQSQCKIELPPDKNVFIIQE
ncbi:MAG: hypothetical protein ACI4EQ_08580 [Lachnospiraceae bacterium]